MTRQVAPTGTATRNGSRPRDGVEGDGVEGAAHERALLDTVLAQRSVWPVFQPIVELETWAPAGYEALARGPEDHPLHLPDALFAAARHADRLTELDTLCRERALEAAQAAGLRPPAVLFVNVEPAALAEVPEQSPDANAAHPLLMRLREQGVHVVAELTERALTAHPARLLAFAERMRALGCGIALDDVGADSASLALMPLLRPDVVKLDLRVVQDQPDAAIARTMTAVTAFAEAHGSTVVAEGVETEEHESTALSLGATHGQGWRYGRPMRPGEGRLSHSALWRPIVPLVERSRISHDSGYALARRDHAPRQGNKRLLSEVSRLLERQAKEMGDLAVVLAAVEESAYFNRVLRERFTDIARHAAFVGVLGAGIEADAAPGVRGADLAPSDPLRHEWNIVVVGPHFAVALVARDQHDTGPEHERRFTYVLTYDRVTVLQIARTLLGRIGS